jgi:hypothetical protein
MAFDPGGPGDPLRGKRILIVGRDYYFYTREIIAELRGTFGASVMFRAIEPPSLVYRILKKAGIRLVWWLRRYHRSVIVAAQRETPDIVLFIQVHQIGVMVESYRQAFQSARFVLYYWDSLKTHHYLPYAKYFDRVCTFDRLDAAQIPEFEYLPLFFAERFRDLRKKRQMIYDMAFVGVAVSMRRYDQLLNVRAWAKANGISLFDYVVVSPILYFRRLLRGQLMREVHFKSLGEQELLMVYSSSRSVLDLPNNTQTGYTMRTFEALGAHRKLVTANRNVINEDFYTAESVFVIGERGELPDRSFLDSEANFSSALESYFLRTWIGRLLRPH